MSRRALLALPACALLVALPALPASAAVDTQSWTSPTHQWWTSGTWSSGEVPENGDTLVFPSTAADRSDANVGDISLVAMQFTGDHLLGSAPPAGVITLTGPEGLLVDGDPAPAEVTINNDLATTGAQSWYVAADNSLVLPALVRVSPSGSLELDVEGELTISGNLDGQVTGLVSKTGAGTVIRSGSAGGAIGGGGLDVQEGVFLLDDASIGGTAFQVSGGTLAGDGVVNAITLTDGTIAPSDGGTGPIEILIGDAGVSLDGGVYEATIDGLGGLSDYLTGGNGVLSGSGTTLELVLLSTPGVGDSFEIAGVQFGTIDLGFRLLSPAGETLEEGDEFVSGGGLWSISYEGVVTVSYLGAAPVEEEPEQPAPTEELPDTGAPLEPFAAAGGAVAVLLLGGALVASVRRRARA